MATVEQQILAGELPEEFLEAYEIVPPEHPLAQRFAGKANEVIRRLLGADYDPNLHNFRVLLSAQAAPNAFVISKADPPVMVFTTELLKLFPSEDHFAAVTAHELTHKRLETRLGEHANSKLEELGSDLWGVKTLQDAGYRPRAMAEMLSLLPDSHSYSLQNYMDVHPNNPLRVRLSENAVDALIKMTGSENTASVPLDTELWEDLGGFNQPRYMQKLLSERGFDDASNTQKLKIISEVLETENLHPKAPYQQQRFFDLAKAFSSIDINKDNPEEVSTLEDLGNQITFRREPTPYGWKNKAGSLYPYVFKLWKKAELPDAPGDAGELAKNMQSFIDAPDVQTATKHAQNMRTLHEKIDTHLHNETTYGNDSVFNDLGIFPRFNPPRKQAVSEIESKNAELADGQHEGMPFPWHKHVRWAKDAVESKGSPDIQIGLALMGVENDVGNPNITWEQPQIKHKIYGYETKYTSLLDPITSTIGWEYKLSDLILTPDIEILGFRQANRFWPAKEAKPTEELVDQFTRSEKSWLATFDDEGRQAAARADWSVWDNPGIARDYDRLVKESGLAEGSPSLRLMLGGFDWFEKSSIKYRYEALTREDIQEHENEVRGSRIREFMRNNKKYIVPQVSIMDGGNAFQDVLTEKWKTLAAAEPETCGPMIRQHFNGIFSGNIKDLPKVSTGYGLPKLLENAAEEAARDKIDLTNLMILDLPLGISPNHPYMSLMRDPNIGLTSQDKVTFLASTRYLKPDKSLDPSARWNFDPVEMLGFAPITKVEDFSERYKEARQHVSSLQELSSGSVSMMGRKARFLSDIMATEVHRHITTADKTFNRDELIALERVSRLGFMSDMIKPARDALDKALIESAHKEVVGKTSTADLAESYSQFSHFGLFLNQPLVRQKYEKEIGLRIESISDPATKRHLTEQILLSREMSPVLLPEAGKGTYISLIADPDFRGRVSNAYVDSLVQLHGKDDGSPEFNARTKPIIDNILKQTSGSIRFGVLSLLADRMEMQKELSYYIRDQIVDSGLVGMAGQNKKVAIGEMSVDTINQSETLRKETIEFLRHPLTQDSAVHYVDAVKKHGNVLSLLPDEAREVVSGLKKQEALYNPDIETEAAIQAHRNFWAMPLEVRTLYLEKIIFPVGSKDPESFGKNKGHVLDICFPKEHEQASQKEPFHRRMLNKVRPSKNNFSPVAARDVVEAYLGVANESEQRLLLSAMLVANEPTTKSGNTPNAGYGKSLRQILYALGPAGVKTAQAIQSHPATPEDLRQDLEESKFNADKPLRWTVHEMLDKNGLSDQVGHVGPVLGAGAYGVTVEAHRNDARPTAVTMLRDHVRPRAEREFGVFMKTCNNLIEKYPQFLPLKDMIKQAKDMSHIETDMDLAARQVKFARRLYNTAVTTDGKTFRFGTAPWLGHGHDYKETEIIPGSHFINLPESTQDQIAYKKSVAKALLTVEQRVLLSGKPFDHDRHGGQQKINGNSIGMFDHGAMALKAPNEQQKVLLGKVIGGALRQHALSKLPLRKEISVADALIQQIDKHSQNPNDARFMTEVKRAFLAQTDYMKPLTPEETKAVIASAWTSPDVHPVIQKGIKEGLGILSPAVLPMVRKEAANTRISVRINVKIPTKSSQRNHEGQKTNSTQQQSQASPNSAIASEQLQGYRPENDSKKNAANLLGENKITENFNVKATPWNVKHLGKVNDKIDKASLGVQLADAAIKKDPVKAFEVAGTAATLHAGMKVAGRYAPVAGQVVGSLFAAKDTYDAVKAGNTTRAAVSGVETTLYSVATVSGAAAAFNFWNPAGWGAGAVAVGAGATAVTISSAKAVYDNWNTVKGWFGYGDNPIAQSTPPKAEPVTLSGNGTNSDAEPKKNVKSAYTPARRNYSRLREETSAAKAKAAEASAATSSTTETPSDTSPATVSKPATRRNFGIP